MLSRRDRILSPFMHADTGVAHSSILMTASLYTGTNVCSCSLQLLLLECVPGLAQQWF